MLPATSLAVVARALQRPAHVAAVCIVACWCIYFIFAPTVGFNLADSWHNEQRVLQITLLAGSTISYLWLVLESGGDRAVGIGSPLWIALGLGAVSACFAAYPSHAAVELALALQLIFLGALFATLTSCIPQKILPALLYFAWLVGLVYVIGVLANYVGVIVEQRSVDPTVFILGYANPRFASALHGLILPLIAWLALHAGRVTLRYSSWTIASLLWATNLALGTRAIWVSFAAAGIAVWWLGDQSARRVVTAVCLSAAFGAILYLLAWALFPFVLPQEGAMHSRMGDLAAERGRFQLWTAAGAQIVAHPLLGMGPMNFATLRGLSGAHPHNWLLQLASEWGLPALAAVLFLIYRWGRRLRAAFAVPSPNAGENLLPAVGLSVFAVLICGLLDGVWVMPVSQSLAVILTGVSVGLCIRTESPKRIDNPQPSGTRRFQCIATLAVGLAASVISIQYTARTFSLQGASERQFAEEIGRQYFFPRFWQQGVILQSPPE